MTPLYIERKNIKKYLPKTTKQQYEMTSFRPKKLVTKKFLHIQIVK